MSSARLLRKYGCSVVLLGLIYLTYASCYVVGKKEIFRYHLEPAAIVLWVLIGICEVSLLYYWILIFQGPGKAPNIQPLNLYGDDRLLTPVPPVFLCDEQGFPFWCSHCQCIKQNRLFHSGDLQFCVDKFDHYCIWVGNAIGRKNYLYFFRFVEVFLVFFVVTLCYSAWAAKLALSRSNVDLPHYVILFVFCVFWIIMLMALLATSLVDIFKNLTTLDGLTIRQARSYSRYESRLKKRNGNTRFMGRAPRRELGIRYVNVAHGDTRKVVPVHVSDQMWNFGARKNLVSLILGPEKISSWANVLVSLAVLTVPYSEFLIKRNHSVADCGDEFSPDFLHLLDEKIDKGQFTYASYLQHKLPGS